MPPAFRPALGVLAGCVAALALTLPASGGAPPQRVAPAATGPAAFAELLARYDREPSEQLAAQLDAIAHQKYATVSRLYWHTDFAAAQAAAREQKRPILHLRMLGNLAEDLSCANSRLFRATLYANRDVSKLLRDKFVLYWSSERAVPKVTIDFGDGRKLERTTTGNSAHYVLDADGNVLDVLPGLYAPIAFRKELAGSLALADRVRGASEDKRAAAVVAYHEGLVKRAQEGWNSLAGTPYMPAMRQLLTAARVRSALELAQRATMMKARIEIADLRYLTQGLVPNQLGDDDVAAWASAGQILYGIGELPRDPKAGERMVVRGELGRGVERDGPASLPPPPKVLDAQSIALVSRLHDAGPVQSTAAEREEMLNRLQQHIVADTALDQLRLRPQISREIISRAGKADFATLNGWIYASVFKTPKQDAWLGLLPRTDFTGVPGDGVVIR